MPEDMKQTISNEQLSLMNELYQREGVLAVMNYLVVHRKIENSVAERWINSLGFNDDSCKSCTTEEVKNPNQQFSHYCTFCTQVWEGVDGSLCPICNTDGIRKPEFTT